MYEMEELTIVRMDLERLRHDPFAASSQIVGSQPIVPCMRRRLHSSPVRATVPSSYDIKGCQGYLHLPVAGSSPNCSSCDELPL